MNHIVNPNMLPKVRSQRIHDAIGGKLPGVDMFPCDLRISSFVPGYRCAAPGTVVPCHVGRIGKGTSTKVSDIQIAAGCLHCHDLLDMRDSRWVYLMETYPAAVLTRVMDANHATIARLIGLGIISIDGGEII